MWVLRGWRGIMSHNKSWEDDGKWVVCAFCVGLHANLTRKWRGVSMKCYSALRLAYGRNWLAMCSAKCAAEKKKQHHQAISRGHEYGNVSQTLVLFLLASTFERFQNMPESPWFQNGDTEISWYGRTEAETERQSRASEWIEMLEPQLCYGHIPCSDLCSHLGDDWSVVRSVPVAFGWGNAWRWKFRSRPIDSRRPTYHDQ